MIRTGTALIIASLMLLAAPVAPASADHAPTATQMKPSPSITLTDVSSQQRAERRPARVRIHRDSRVLGPQHVRDCEAHYVQEHRPSGTVIVPRMNCFWRHR